MFHGLFKGFHYHKCGRCGYRYFTYKYAPYYMHIVRKGYGYHSPIFGYMTYKGICVKCYLREKEFN